MNLTVLGNFHIPRPLRGFWRFCTMVENKKKHRQNSHPIIHCPTREGVSEVSERANKWAQRRARAKRAVWSKGRSERCEWTSERANGRANGPVLTSVFFSIFDHSVLVVISLTCRPRSVFIVTFLFYQRNLSSISITSNHLGDVLTFLWSNR